VADPLHALLDLQDHDVAADQLRHRKAALPERRALADAEAGMAAVDAEAGPVNSRMVDLRRSQKRLEDEIATVEEKASAENLKLYSGSITAARELQALQEEIEGLGKRQRVLEDELLELMEAAEPVQAELDGLAARRAEHERAAEAAREALAAAEAVLDAELDGVLVERAELAATMQPDVLARYDGLRSKLGGVAVARLEGNLCLGCHLTLPSTEVDAIRHAAPDALVLHEECGRILVRR
jgi:predicted  nucleic acid-binding Zn-ribbon protein